MKRIAVLVTIMLILSIFIVSCVPAEDTADKKDTDVLEDKDVVELPNSAMNVDEAEDEATPDNNYDEDSDQDYDQDVDDGLVGLPADLVVLMAKGKDKARNIHYLYRGPPLEFRDAYEYFILGDKIKMVRSEPQHFVRGEYYNVIYINTKTGESVGYCEDDKRCDDVNAPFESEYNEYFGTLPGEWFDRLDNAYKVGSEDIFNREAIIYEFDYNGVKSKIWIDPFYGIPLQVRIDEYGGDPTVYHYEIQKAGSVKVTDVEHQIPD